MTERSYISTDWGDSPRIVEVASVGNGGANEVTLQDLNDTLKSNTLQASENDDSLDNLDDDPLIDSAGKENLGGGQLVGITSTFLNTQLAFEGNYTPAETGTATSADANGTSLTDTAATFQTNNVERGAVIINFTDQSVAEVLKVNSETQLDHRVLQAGINDDWTSGDAYAIFNVIQKDISGGNLVALDDMDAELSPVFPTFATQIVRTASSSATLQELEAIQFNSFAGGVWYDSTSSFSGTTYPKGTPQEPVNNTADVEAIANERGFRTVFVLGNLALTSGAEDWTGFTFIGQSRVLSTLTIDPAASVLNTTFQRATITGTLDGSSTIEDCNVNTLAVVNGDIVGSSITGPITLGGTAQADFVNCESAVAGSATPVIDMGGSGQALTMRNYSGGVRLENKSGADAVSIDLVSGQIKLHTDITNGTIVCRGNGKLIDTSDNDIPSGNFNGATIVNELVDGRVIAQLNAFVQGNRDIDFTGNDALGWQRIQRDTSGVELARYNLFDEDGSRITGTVSDFLNSRKMIASEVLIP